MTTAVILAGGKSRRMGRNKMLLPYRGKTLLETAIEKYSRVFDRVLVSVAEEDSYAISDEQRVRDLYPGCGSLAGLHAALRACGGDGVFLAAADLPYAEPMAAFRLTELCGDAEVCLTRDMRGRFEPLFAFYKASVLPLAEEALSDGRYSMHEILDKAVLRIAEPSELGGLWSERMLMNVNYPEDFEKLQ